LARDHAARCSVLGRPGNHRYPGSLPPCSAWFSRPRSGAALPEGALALVALRRLLLLAAEHALHPTDEALSREVDDLCIVLPRLDGLVGRLVGWLSSPG